MPPLLFYLMALLAYLQLTISSSLPHKSRLIKIKKPVAREIKEAENIDYSFRLMLVKKKDGITLRVLKEDFLYLFLNPYGYVELCFRLRKINS